MMAFLKIDYCKVSKYNYIFCTNCYLGHKDNILPYNSWDYLKNKEVILQ